MGCEGYCEAGTPRGELALKIGVAVVVGGGWTGLRGGAARGPHVHPCRPLCELLCACAFASRCGGGFI